MTKKNNILKAIVIIFAVIIAVLVGVVGYLYVSNDINGKGGSEEPITLTITDGSDLYDISQILYKKGIVVNDSVWSNWMDRHYNGFEIIGGDYELNASMSYEEIAQALKNPVVTRQSISVCIPEGYNIFQIARTLDENGVCSADDFLNACKNKDDYDYSFIADIPNITTIAYPLEGFLFPATYDFEENMTAFEVVDTMLGAFADRISDSWRAYCTDNNMTMYELVTLASVVEKETLGEGVAERIASVFINRLENGQQLQSDVTIDYGNALRENGFSDEVVFSYNTYKCKALPSGPICNPGVENIDAVVNHEDTNYFYFFSYNNGADFYFTDNYTDFQKEWAKLGKTNTN